MFSFPFFRRGGSPWKPYREEAPRTTGVLRRNSSPGLFPCLGSPAEERRFRPDAPLPFRTALLQIVLAHREGAVFLTQSRFFHFCHLLWEQKQGVVPEGNLIRKAKALLEELHPRSMEQIAQELQISPSGLRKKFKDATGLSPTLYRQKKRLERSEEFLCCTDLPLEEIAQRCCFYDTAHFCRDFKRQKGVPPGEYRKKIPFLYNKTAGASPAVFFVLLSAKGKGCLPFPKGNRRSVGRSGHRHLRTLLFSLLTFFLYYSKTGIESQKRKTGTDKRIPGTTNTFPAFFRKNH